MPVYGRDWIGHAVKILLIVLNVAALFLILLLLNGEVHDPAPRRIFAVIFIAANIFIAFFADLKRKKIIRMAASFSLMGIIGWILLEFMKGYNYDFNNYKKPGASIEEYLNFIVIGIWLAALPIGFMIDRALLRPPLHKESGG